MSSKLLTVFAPFTLIFVFPVFIKFIHTGFFLWFPYGIMIIGASSFYIFSFEKERVMLHFIILFFFIAAIFYDKVLAKSIPNDLNLSFIYGENHLYYQASKVLLLLFFYSSLYHAKLTIYKHRQQLASFNSLLDKKNRELSYVNKNLESIVKERTMQLDSQNQRIKELTYTNSHKVRAYVARILGLISLTHFSSGEKEIKTYYDQVEKTALELDEETKFVSKKLSEEY